MADSILTSTKSKLGITDPEVTAFDNDIIPLINMAFNTLTQIGVGPDEGFFIEDDTATWEDFIGDDRHIKVIEEYVYLVTKVIFDSSTMTAATIEIFKEQAKQIECRLQYDFDVVRQTT